MSDEPEDDPLRRIGWMVGIAVAVVAAIGVVLMLVTPDDGLLETPLDEWLADEPEGPIWGIPGPMQGAPLEPGPCAQASSAGDPSSVSLPDDGTPWPSGLVLWLRSDLGVVRDPGADRVVAWRDLSAASHDLEAASDDAAPRWVQRAWRCLPALRFAGSDQLLRRDALGLAPDHARSFVVVSRLRDRSERSQLLSQGEPGSLSRHVGLEANTWETAGERYGVYWLGNSFDSAAATHRDPTVHVLALAGVPTDASPDRDDTAVPDAAPFGYWIDGVRQDVARRSGTGAPRGDLVAATHTSLGRFVGPGGFGWRGDVFEVQVYDRALDAGARQAIDAAARRRYGIAPAGTEPD